MAVGKCETDTDIDQTKVVIRFGSQELFPNQVSDKDLEQLSSYMRGDTVRIHVSLGVTTGTSGGTATVWGCDLTDGYVRINADYTT
jgi:glutamate N-acetyltransferase/amino-acid N-acetyltransferase